ncbi:hypothetical protein LQZ19_19215 [Treponema primitia]|uniref:hypothetical protein n=1 Tax=Treponema primitia TaxID=88058 RepID=UPI0039814C86
MSRKNVRSSPRRKPGTGKSLSRRFRLVSALAALVLVLIAVFILTRPPLTWYVEEGLESPWRRILNTGSPPRGFKRDVRILKPGETPPRKGQGFIITRKREESGQAVTVYPRLSFDLEYQGAMVLALDPWMVFRNHQYPSLTRDRIVSKVGEGVLLIPGSDPDAVRAWAARLLEQPEGEFPQGPEQWQEAESSLFTSISFPRGSISFNWQDVWQILLGKDISWTYAPLSRVRDLPAYRSNILEATVFPGPGENRFGLQAEILWAIPQGSPGVKPKLKEAAVLWLKSGETQTLIADTLRWLPAAPEGKPFNPAAMSARLAWLTCSYVWEQHGD